MFAAKSKKNSFGNLIYVNSLLDITECFYGINNLWLLYDYIITDTYESIFLWFLIMKNGIKKIMCIVCVSFFFF